MNTELKLDKHISKRYNQELENLRQQVITMGRIVEEQLKDSLQSLFDADIKLAKSVIKKDNNVNKVELEISAQCVEIIALRQPTAADLRLILTVEKSITDLERIGDLSANLAKLSKKLINKGVSTRYYTELQHVGVLANKMLAEALNAFARLDATSAVETMAIRNKIKRESTALSRQLITYMIEDPRTIKQTLRVLNAAKDLERIGSHCENLCEYIVYLVKGEDVRHQSFDDIRASVIVDDEED